MASIAVPLHKPHGTTVTPVGWLAAVAVTTYASGAGFVDPLTTDGVQETDIAAAFRAVPAGEALLT